jgi:hypothetical protein
LWPALESAGDVFCFGSFTGQRISKEQIKNDTWTIHQKKTHDLMQIPSNEFALEILRKYKGKNRPLPIVSDQKTNENLKTICKMASIDEDVKKSRLYGQEVKLNPDLNKILFLSTSLVKRLSHSH